MISFQLVIVDVIRRAGRLQLTVKVETMWWMNGRGPNTEPWRMPRGLVEEVQLLMHNYIQLVLKFTHSLFQNELYVIHTHHM